MKTKHFTPVLLLIFSLIIINSCSTGQLSRNEAKKQIIEKLGLPQNIEQTFYVTDGTLLHRFDNQVYEALQNEGLLTYNTDAGSNTIYATLTEQGKQYAVSSVFNTDNMYIQGINVKVAKLDFGEITGIVERKEFNMAQVEYTIVRTEITPFGRIAFKYNESPETKTAVFSKFDDGWRIQK
jgi:hypothetical protein